MKLFRFSLLLWLILALLLLAWATVTGRLGTSRHGYAAAEAPCPFTRA